MPAKEEVPFITCVDNFFSDFKFLFDLNQEGVPKKKVRCSVLFGS